MITVTIANTVSEGDFQRIEELVRHLQESDYNFVGRAVWVVRGFATEVTDPTDALRGALLRLTIDSVLGQRVPGGPAPAS
jgi:hypothetical protein